MSAYVIPRPCVTAERYVTFNSAHCEGVCEVGLCCRGETRHRGQEVGGWIDWVSGESELEALRWRGFCSRRPLPGRPHHSVVGLQPRLGLHLASKGDFSPPSHPPFSTSALRCLFVLPVAQQTAANKIPAADGSMIMTHENCSMFDVLSLVSLIV